MLATLTAFTTDEMRRPFSLASVLDAVDRESTNYRRRTKNTAIMHGQARRSFAAWAAANGVQSVAQITVDVLRAYVATLAASRAARTIRLWAAYIRRLIIEAAALGYTPKIDGRLIGWLPDTHGAPVARPVLTPAEVQAVLASAEQRGPRALAVVHLALCGLRTAEIAALKVRDVDAAGGRVRIAGRGGAEWIDVFPDAAAALRAYLASECRHKKADDYFWRGYTPYWVQRQLRAALSDAGITRPGVCPGSFRATARATARAQLQ